MRVASIPAPTLYTDRLLLTPIGIAHSRGVFRGKGYMREAATEAIEWARAHLSSKHCEALIEDCNLRSIGLVTRLGFIATAAYSEQSQRYLRVLH